MHPGIKEGMVFGISFLFFSLKKLEGQKVDHLRIPTHTRETQPQVQFPENPEK